MKEKIKRGAGVLFGAGLLCELIVSPSGYLFGGYHEPQIIVAGMVLFSLSVLLRVCADLPWLRRELPVYVLVCAYGMLCYHAQHSALILRIVLILLAGREKKPEEVIRFFFGGTVLIMLLGVFLCIFGGHNALMVTDKFRHEEESRLTLGFYHPNGLAFFLFRVYAMWVFLYGEKAGRWKAVPVAAVFGILFFLNRSKAGILIFVLLTAALILFRQVRSRKIEQLLYAGGILLTGLILALMAFLRFWPLPQQNYGNAQNYWDYMNEFTTGRMELARNALLAGPYSFFGSLEVQNGTEVGFVNALLEQGVIFMLLFLAAFVIRYRKMYMRKERYGMLFALSFLIYAMAEAYLPYFNKNGIWMLLVGWGLSVGNTGPEETGPAARADAEETRDGRKAGENAIQNEIRERDRI